MFYKGEIPFVRLIVPLIGGISLGFIFTREAAFHYAFYLALVSLLVFILLIINYRKFSIYRSGWLTGLLPHFFIFLTGYCLTVKSSGKLDKVHYSLQESDALIAVVTSEPRLSKGILRYESRVKENYYLDKKSISAGNIMISIQTDSTGTFDLRYGDVVLIPAAYNPVDPPYNPGEFDYRSYLANRQIHYQSFLSQNEVFIIGRGEGSRLISFAITLRKQLVKKFHDFLPDKDAAAFASTLILGYRAELSQELVEAYAKTGTMHVLSVSGMHVGIVFMVLSAMLKFMDSTSRATLIRALIIIAAIWFYALITGFSASACRAAVMLSFIVVGKAINRHQNTYNLIAISAFFLLLYNPFYLVDAGFQLSYLAVTGLVYFHPRIYRSLYVKNRLADHIWSYSALSLAAQLATFPVSIYYFHQFPLYFLFSNLFIVFPVAVIMYAGIVFMFIPGSVILSYLSSYLAALISFTNNILYWIENLPYSSWSGIWVSTIEYVLIYLLIICASLRLGYNNKQVLLPFAGFLILLCSSFSFSWLRNNSRVEVIYFNLRKNSAVAYLKAGRSIIVSDVASSDKLSDFSLVPGVQSRGSEEETFYRTDQSFSGRTYTGLRNFYQFGDYRLIRWDKGLDHQRFLRPLKVNAVLVSGNPATTIKEINSCLDFSMLILDANNPVYKIDRWVAEAKEMNLSYYVLKKNPALIVKL